MTTQGVQFIDQSQSVLATAQVADEGDHFGGTIDLHLTPPELRALFDEFEEIVNGQMFVFLDEIRAKIGAWPMKAKFDDGSEVRVQDLQVFPSTAEVSFRFVNDRSQPARVATRAEQIADSSDSECAEWVGRA